MRIVSWNVNGLRACARKGFLRFLADSDADVVGIQEVRAFEHQLEPDVHAPDGWHTSFSPAERAGYSGVALYSREPPTRVETALGEPRFDAEGRLVIAAFGRLSVASVYFPRAAAATGTTAASPISSTSTPRSSTGCRPCDAAGRSSSSATTTRHASRSISRGRPPTRRPAASCGKSARS